MIVTIGGIPVFEALLSDEQCGMIRVSLVDDPAVSSLFQAFDADRKPMLYSVQNEEKRLVRGCVMRADFPILRYGRDGEFYMVFRADTIREMAEKYLMEGRQNLVNLMHQGEDVMGVQLVQWFIKGEGVQVDGFDDCADGSLFAEFHVTNDDVWEQVKAGTFKGFSLEGYFDLAPEQDKDAVQEIVDLLEGAFRKLTNKSKNMSKMSRFKAALAKVLAEFGNVTTDKGILSWDGDDDLKAGDNVYIENEEGETSPAPDGEYRTDDAKVIVVEGGKVVEIRDDVAEVAPEAEPEAEAEPAEEVAAEEVPEEMPAEEPEADPKDERIAELEARIAELEAMVAERDAEIAALKSEVEDMQKMSAAKPAHEEVKGGASAMSTGNKGLDRLQRYLKA